MTNDLSVESRAKELANLLGRCVITDRESIITPLEQAINETCKKLISLRTRGGSLYLIGNGGSAGVASHATTDFFNVGKIRATTLHESSLMTCMANDFGYENAYSRMVQQLVRPDDILVAISSSGKSVNILNAAREAANNGGYVVTLSGFGSCNPLRELGHTNFWIDSKDYGLVEIGHQFLLHNIADRLSAKF